MIDPISLYIDVFKKLSGPVVFNLDGAQACTKRVSGASMVLERELVVERLCASTERRIWMSFDDELLLFVVMCVLQGGGRCLFSGVAVVVVAIVTVVSPCSH